MKIIAIFAIFISSMCYADDLTMTFGSGIFDSLQQTHQLYAGYNSYFNERTMFWRSELGGYTDTAGNGRSGSYFGAQMLGVNAENNIVYAQGAAGVAAITTTDAYLGSNMNFTEELGVGINGGNNTKVGIVYKHMSNAGFAQPNIGRDFIGAQISVPLF